SSPHPNVGPIRKGKPTMLNLLAGVAHQFKKDRDSGLQVSAPLLQLFLKDAHTWLKSNEGIAAMQRQILNPSASDMGNDALDNESGQLRLVLIELEQIRTAELDREINRLKVEMTPHLSEVAQHIASIGQHDVVDTGVRNSLARSIGEAIAPFLSGHQRASHLSTGRRFLVEGELLIDELVQAGLLTSSHVGLLSPLLNVLRTIPLERRSNWFEPQLMPPVLAPLSLEDKITHLVNLANELKGRNLRAARPSPLSSHPKLVEGVGKLVQERSREGAAIRTEPAEKVGRLFFTLEDAYFNELVQTNQLPQEDRAALARLTNAMAAAVGGPPDLSTSLEELSARVAMFNDSPTTDGRSEQRAKIRSLLNGILRQVGVAGSFVERNTVAWQLMQNPKQAVDALAQEGKMIKRFAPALEPVVELVSTMMLARRSKSGADASSLPSAKINRRLEEVAQQVVKSRELSGDARSEAWAAIAFRVGKLLADVGGKMSLLKEHNETSIGLELMNQPDLTLRKLLASGVLEHSQALNLGPLMRSLGGNWPPPLQEAVGAGTAALALDSLFNQSGDTNAIGTIHQNKTISDESLVIANQAGRPEVKKRRRRIRREDTKVWENSRVMKILTGEISPFDH
ncbi:MAG: hypothetical protein AB7V46_16295, partial [Thermomicrobiales bacterium]